MPLRFPESTAFGSGTAACAAAFDIHMFRMAFVITVIDTLDRFTVDADRLAGMLQRTRVGAIPFLCKTLTARIRTTVRMFSAHHDIALATALVLIIGTVIHSTF